MSHLTSKFKSTPTITFKSRNSCTFTLTQPSHPPTSLPTCHLPSNTIITTTTSPPKLGTVPNSHKKEGTREISLSTLANPCQDQVPTIPHLQWTSQVSIKKKFWPKESPGSDRHHNSPLHPTNTVAWIKTKNMHPSSALANWKDPSMVLETVTLLPLTTTLSLKIDQPHCTLPPHPVFSKIQSERQTSRDKKLQGLVSTKTKNPSSRLLSTKSSKFFQSHQDASVPPNLRLSLDVLLS